MKPSYEELEQKLVESQREFRAADATIENLQMQVEKLSAENAGLKSVDVWMNADEVGGSAADKAIENGATPEEATRAGVQAVIDSFKTPATDAFLAEVRARGVEEFLRDSQLSYQIATVLADYDNVDDATLQTVIWSGQPPEPDGDIWHLEYVSRGNAIVRAILKELRKGVQS